MAIVNIPGVGLVDNVTGKPVKTNPITKQKNTKQIVTNVTTKGVTPKAISGVGTVGANGQVVTVSNINPKATGNNGTVNKGLTNTNTGSGTGNNTNTNTTTNIPVAPTMKSSYANTSAGNINRLADAKAVSQYNAYKDTYTNAIDTYNKQQTDAQKLYQKNKHDATVQSDMQRLNFQQYLLARGAGSGAQAQAELQNSAGLVNSVGTLRNTLNDTTNTINANKTKAQQKFVNDWNNYKTINEANRQDTLFKQQQADAKAVADAAEKAQKNTSNEVVINGKTYKQLTPTQQLARPSSVISSINAQFGKGDVQQTGARGKVTYSRSPKQQRQIWTFILDPANQLTVDQQWNMMTQFGMGQKKDRHTGLVLGPKNLFYFIQNLKNSGDNATMVKYLKKLGFRDEEYNYGNRKTRIMTVDEQINNILSGKDKYGRDYN